VQLDISIGSANRKAHKVTGMQSRQMGPVWFTVALAGGFPGLFMSLTSKN
jgi:hypothetical protein